MYNHTTIISCLKGLIGFESSYNADQPTIDEDLLASDSGIYVSSALHPLLTYENILAIAEQFSKVNIRVYSNTASYKINDIVKSGSDIYQSLQGTNLNHLVTDGDWWVKTNLLSAFLRKVYAGSVVKLFSQLFIEKKMNEVAKSILASVHLFEGVGRLTDRITKTGKMVGYKIRVNHPDTIALLSHIGLQLDTIQNNVKIYLYHTSSNQPVKIFTINHTKSVQFEWHAITSEILSHLSDTINAAGSYYLTYYEEELTGEAIKKEISFSGRNLCGSCSEGVVNQSLYNKWSGLVSIQPFYINAVDVPKDGSSNPTHELWNEEKEIYVDDTSWGMNLQLSVQCDVSMLICRSRNVLTDVLAKQLTVDMLTEMTFSMRDNQLKGKVAQLAASALDNQEGGQYGEQKKLMQAMKALSFDLSSMSKVCLPCSSSSGIARIKSVWS
jgi:hypothetical protein